LGPARSHRTAKGDACQLRLVRTTIYAAPYRRVSAAVLLDRAPPSILDCGAALDDAGD
jgi:hypothetical protein